MSGLRRLWWLWVPLGAVVLVAFAWLAWYGVARWQVSRIKDEIRAAGLPITEAEIIPAEIPDDVNAAPLLKRAETVWKQLSEREGFIAARVASNAPEFAPEKFDKARLAQLQAQMRWPETQELFRLMHVAASRRAAVFDRDYSKGHGTDIGPLIPLFSAVQQLASRSWLAAKESNQKEAVEDLLACSRLATFGLRDVFLIGWMIGASFDGIAIGGAQSVIAALPTGSFRMKDWQTLDDLWAAHAAEARADLVRTIDGERVLLGMWIFEQVMLRRISLGEEMAKRTDAASSEDAAVMRRMTRIYETALIPLLVSDYATYLRLMLSVREALQDGRIRPSAEQSFAQLVPGWAIISRITAPTFDGITKLFEEYEVNLQLGRLGLALEDFRSREGKYPATLRELGLPDSEITDPFTGQLFVYRPDGDSVLVYSVGADRGDDGGNSAPLAKPHDLVWRVKRG